MILILGVLLLSFGIVVSVLAFIEVRDVQRVDLSWGRLHVVSFAALSLVLGGYLIHSSL